MSCLFVVCPSVRLCAWSNSALTEWIFMKFDILSTYKKINQKDGSGIKI
jgi:hypothetical protein